MKIFRTILCVILTLVLLIIGFIVFAVVIPTHNNMTFLGSYIGQTTGTWIGTAIGSFNGITVEAEHGYEDGVAEGLSAEDTYITVVEDAYSLGTDKLQVLRADVSINNKVQVGDDKNIKYAVLYVINGELSFSVDLSKADYKYENDKITITLPDTETELYLDEGTEAEIIATYQKDYIVKEDDKNRVLEGLINERSKVLNNTCAIDNYEELHKVARECAIKQVEELVKSSTVDKVVVVKFEEE